MKYLTSVFLLSFLLLAFCNKKSNDLSPEAEINGENSLYALVLSVTASGSESNYNFSVTLSSPDLGCNQYADWWEILNEEGELLYRRVLGHSHVNEQPFTRSGGPVQISAEEVIFVRGHMNKEGYGRQGMKGSVEDGFSEFIFDEDFQEEVASQDPQPPDCAF